MIGFVYYKDGLKSIVDTNNRVSNYLSVRPLYQFIRRDIESAIDVAEAAGWNARNNHATYTAWGGRGAEASWYIHPISIERAP